MSQSNPNQLLTIPNLISLSRLLGVPVFVWTIVSERFGLALIMLMYAGSSDWADGVLARRLDQYSKVGEMLDPLADRLYIGCTIIGLAWVGIVAWWFVAAVVLRDLVMLIYVLWLRFRGIDPAPVHYIGKAATMLLLYAFPMLLLGQVFPSLFNITRAFGWAFGLWGLVMYWYAASLYWGEREDVAP